MKIIFKLNLVLIFVINSAYSEINNCSTESEVPSSTPDSRYTDNGDGTVTDSDTSLMWQKCELGLSGNECNIGFTATYMWEQALYEAEDNELAGYDDWRLPNIKELISIIELQCRNPAINATYFPNTSSRLFWSASPTANYADGTWAVLFIAGTSSHQNRSSMQRARLVRYVK